MHLCVGRVGPGRLRRHTRGKGTGVGTSYTWTGMYGEGGAMVGDHTPSVLGRVADSQRHGLTIITTAMRKTHQSRVKIRSTKLQGCKAYVY